jgi:hypothetical protein
MSQAIRVAHFLNQFFAGIGGEEAADMPPRLTAGPVGLGRALAEALGTDGVVVCTLVAGDNWLAQQTDAAARDAARGFAPYGPQILLAGPALAAGRYGLACGKIAEAARAVLGIETVGGGGTYASRPGGDTGEVVPLAGEPIPASLSGPTKLRVVVTTGLDQEEHRFELACQPEPTGVPDAASVCERILRERWALFVPGSEGVCSVPAGSHAVVIIGTVGGKPVDIGYDACYGATVERWEALLGMPSGHDS